MAKSDIKAGVLPAGSTPALSSLKKGIHRITVLKVGDNNELVVKYPDGFIRDHQAASNVELCSKITNNLRARFGADAVKFINAPEVTEGAVYEVEV